MPSSNVYEAIRTRTRELERRIEKCELREQQIIILLKSILDKVRGRLVNSKKRMSYEDLIKYMESIIRDRLENKNTDLVEELVSKSI
tara:strand:- start:98 stop:358 length:261 start_codon:yes stop_codon:yes gene_type:complete